MSEFRVVDDPVEAEAIKASPTKRGGRGGPGPKTLALMDGKVIWTKMQPGASAGTLGRYGFRLHSREHDGGYYLWAEKKLEPIEP